MRKRSIRLRVLLSLLAVGGCATVEGPQSGVPFPPPPLDLRSLPPPPLRPGLGSSAMTVSTNSTAAQAYFNQGLNLLHGFWYFEAWRAFSEMARQDSSCAMAYWGIYQSLRGNNSNPGAKKRAMARAKELLSTASRREGHYIRAYAHLDSLGRRGHAPFLGEMIRQRG